MLDFIPHIEADNWFLRALLILGIVAVILWVLPKLPPFEFLTKNEKKRRNEDGASAVEYGLLIALLALAFVILHVSFRYVVADMFNDSACNPELGYYCQGGEGEPQ